MSPRIRNRRGQVVGHHGSFRYGEDTQTLGVAMPAKPKPGMRYVFEDIPGQGSERNRIAKTDTHIELGGEHFNHVVKVRGFVKPEREHEVKWFARGVG